MKSLRFILFSALISTGFAAGSISVPLPKPASDEILLAAIAEVETGNNSAVLGHYGERTRLQILPDTWRRFSHLPFSASAANRAETDRVARAYLASIRERLRSRGLPETPFFIAAGWNAGPGWKTLSSGTVSYAERVANLVEAMQPKRPSVPAAHTLAVEAPLPGGTMVVALNSTRPIFHLAESE